MFETHSMSFTCTELLLFNYAKVKTVFHSMAPLKKGKRYAYCIISKVHISSNCQVKSSHLYLYSAFNNTNCDKATAQYKNGKIVSIM